MTEPMVNPVGQAVNDLAPTPSPSPSPTPSSTPAPGAEAAAAAPTGEAPAKPESAVQDSLLTAPPAEADKPAETAAEFKMEDVKLPEGMTIPEDLAPRLTEVAKEAGLTAAQISALAPLHAQIVKDAADANVKAYQETNAAWVDEVKADPEIGGAKLDGTLKSIGKVLDQYGTPELRRALAYTGAGNHPEVIRFMAKIATQLNEGGPTRTGAPTGDSGKPAGKGPQALYPNLQG